MTGDSRLSGENRKGDAKAEMRHKLSGRLAAVIAAAVLLTVLAVLPGGAAEGDSARHVPSIFYNDEAWFKDEVLPSVMRDGYCYVPAEFFSMINYINYSVYDGDNILISTTDGKYISILFSDGSAVANGKNAGYAGIFRDSGVYYVRAEDVAGPLGLRLEYTEDPRDPSKSIIRFYDGETAFSLEALVQSYMSPQTDPRYLIRDDITTAADDTRKKICFVITPPEDGGSEYVAWNMLEDAGLKYTVFLGPDPTAAEILKASYQGDYGLYTGQTDFDSTMKAAAEAKAYTLTGTRLLLSDGERDPEYIRNGFIFITPDLHVNGNTGAADIYGRILEITSEKHYCIIRLDDCWNSDQVIRMIQRLDSAEYSVVNLCGR